MRSFFAPILFLLAQALALQNARAIKIVIVTDQTKAVKAQEVAALFRSTEPFSRLKNLDFKVIKTSSAKLGCNVAPPTALDVAADKNFDLLENVESRDRLATSLNLKKRSARFLLPASCNDQGSTPPTRLIACDSIQSILFLGALKKTEKAAFVIVVKDEPRYGGSGGENPVITTGSPASMAIHELLHQLGFADEYNYLNACEADLYCPPGGDDTISRSGFGSHPTTAFNVAVFLEEKSYGSSDDVRNKHNKQIHWLNFIDKKTELLTNGKVGTPQRGLIGLYRSGVCEKASTLTPTWESVSEPTIMRTLKTTYIPKDYWPTIAKSLNTKIEGQ